MIKIERYADLSIEIRDRLSNYIHEEFGHIPIVVETEWAIPDWTVIKYKNEQLLAFYNIVLRDVSMDSMTCRAGGINNVITPKEFRGNGYATNLLKEAESLLFDKFHCDIGLLFCADEMLPYYKKLNWYKVNSVVSIDQKKGKMQWNSNTMLLSRKKQIMPKVIDINGLPW